jgi:hypothetical protein
MKLTKTNGKTTLHSLKSTVTNSNSLVPLRRQAGPIPGGIFEKCSPEIKR